MAQELTAYFDERFREFAQKILEETARQIAASREETAQQIAESREETARQFAASRKETAEQIAKLRKETIQRFEQVEKRFKQGDKHFASLEETTRHTRVLVEDLQSKIELIAEQHGGLAANLERFQREAMITFDQVRGWMEPYFRTLNARLLILEKRAKRQDKDSSSTVL